MTLAKDYSFVVMPFLKTSGEVSVGGLTFRSTDDPEGLSCEQEEKLHEVAEMLFLRDNLRIKSAAYALAPYIDLNQSSAEAEHAMHIQSVIAYCYAKPRHEFGDIFFPFEQTSTVILTPEMVPLSLVRPDHHVEMVGPAPVLDADKLKKVAGYAGLYNFTHHFWVAKGSRIYGPNPNPTLNISQDLKSDLPYFSLERTDYRLLLELVRKPKSASSLRTYTALRWFNKANSEASDQVASIVSLCIAFETLLALPRVSKAVRLADAISLLLGRIPRLDVWAQQFYSARSRIVHEGHALQLRFVATDSKKNNEGPLYQTLLSYGRLIFQLCLGTLLGGTEMAESAGLQEKLITNQERFQEIYRVLSDDKTGPVERLLLIEPIIASIEQYYYVPDNALQIKTMISAIRLAAKACLACDTAIYTELKRQLERFVATEKTNDRYLELDVLRELNSLFEDKTMPIYVGSCGAIRDLIKVVWKYVFMYYYWAKDSNIGKD